MIGTEKQVEWASKILETQIKKINELMETTNRRGADNVLSQEFVEKTAEYAALAIARLNSLSASQLIANKDRVMADMVEYNVRKFFTK